MLLNGVWAVRGVCKEEIDSMIDGIMDVGGACGKRGLRDCGVGKKKVYWSIGIPCLEICNRIHICSNFHTSGA